jgi:hypothetical protein
LVYFSGENDKRIVMRFPQTTILLLSVALFASCNFPDFSGQPHLPDEQLIENFKTHRAEFEKLVAMVLEDKSLTRVDEDWTQPENLANLRVAEYRQLFKVVGTPRGVSARLNRESIEFIASSQGWAVHGSSKGYLYSEKTPEYYGKPIDGLDEISLAERPYGSGYRHIEGNWYLYFGGD